MKCERCQTLKNHISALEAELEHWKGVAATETQAVLNYDAEVAELRRDRERLDWLEARSSCVNITIDKGSTAAKYHGRTVRKSIDTAMEGK